MKIFPLILAKTKENRGVTAIIVAVMLFLLLAIAAFAVDIGYLKVSRNELQNIADASALAATQRLGTLYPSIYEAQQTFSCDSDCQSQIISTAQNMALENKAAGSNIDILPNEVIMGTWDLTTRTLTQTFARPMAVQVTARRDTTANGNVGTFFAQMFGTTSVPVTAVATASLTGQCTGKPMVPYGISASRVAAGCPQNGNVDLSPTSSPYACGGWMTFNEGANARNLRDILNGLAGNTYSTQDPADGNYNFINGDIAGDFDAFKALFDARKVPNDGSDPWIPMTYPYTWTTTAAIYAGDDCTPNGGKKIVGFTTITIYNVVPPPNRVINAHFKCDYLDAGRGGGCVGGNIGTVPNLVK